MIRDRQLNVRVNREEHEMIARLAAREDRALGNVVRRIVLQAARANDREEKPHAQPKPTD